MEEESKVYFFLSSCLFFKKLKFIFIFSVRPGIRPGCFRRSAKKDTNENEKVERRTGKEASVGLILAVESSVQ